MKSPAHGGTGRIRRRPDGDGFESGVINPAQSVGTATGPLVAGVMYDPLDTYQRAFILFAALYVIAIPAVLLVRRPGPRTAASAVRERDLCPASEASR